MPGPGSSGADGPDHDVVVIGSGVAGIYELYQLTRRGFDVLVVDEASDIGGTWYWNRYPGARFDSESYTYGFSFSPELLAEWDWSEMFAAQPETLRYLRHVVDRFDLRRHMRFDTRVDAAHFDDDAQLWRLTTAGGDPITARFVITAMGILSVPTLPRLPGMDEFTGPSFHTHDWPDGLDVTGKRVAVVGTGSSGIQVISEIASSVESLTVFQRHPSWCAPLHNSPIEPARMREIKADYDAIFEQCRSTPGGFLYGPDRRSTFDVAEEDRQKFWQELYDSPGFAIWYSNFRDMFTDPEANAAASEFIADKIRERVDDPELAEKLIPRDHGFGTRRVVMEINYFEVYNRDNVELVDLLETPIVEVTPTGLRTLDTEYDVDVIIYATGYDGIIGTFDRMDIVGADGRVLRDEWRDDPTTYLGVQITGFPNLFMLGGPQGGSLATNYTRGTEETADWVTGLLEYAREHGYTRVEARPEAQDEWYEHVQDRARKMLLMTTRSWLTGINSNLDGRTKIKHLGYLGGARKYRARLAEVADSEYATFAFR